MYVYQFSEGDKTMFDLLGGKGANLAEMTKMGIPVPPGFTISTEACRFYLSNGEEPAELEDQVAAAVTKVEEEVGRKLGDGVIEVKDRATGERRDVELVEAIGHIVQIVRG